MDPIICFGQQPNGILPKNFFVAKIRAARELQKKIGGKIVWFMHDADHDPRETRTRIPYAQHPEGFIDVNFTFKNKIQRKFTPLAHKEIAGLEQIRNALASAAPKSVQAFDKVSAHTAAEFCLEMYAQLGLLEDIEIVRSSDHTFRAHATIPENTAEGWFYDTEYNGELVRAKILQGKFILHQGGNSYIDLGPAEISNTSMLNPGRNMRFNWMQSAVQATHYIVGASEQEYLQNSNIQHPPIFVPRQEIERPMFSWKP